MCILVFFVSFIQKNNYFLINITVLFLRCMQKYMRSLCKVSGISCPDLTKISCLSINFTSLFNLKFHENLFNGNSIIAGGHRERETGIHKANRHIFANLI
jgi:hypothetical protein